MATSITVRALNPGVDDVKTSGINFESFCIEIVFRIIEISSYGFNLRMSHCLIIKFTQIYIPIPMYIYSDFFNAK